RQAVGQRVQIVALVESGIWPVHVDRSELETAILNLVINARDAMKGGGDIEISVGNCTLLKGGLPGAAVAPGDYVAIAIKDGGKGMDQDIIRYAFEPFFTTKDVGEGTGLGLAQVHGFVTQGGG